jgi:SET domain-containing protein
MGLYFPLVSSLNHACDPTCDVSFSGGAEARIRARRALNSGDELTIAYVNEQLPRAERRARLREHYGFECACRRCSAEQG